MAWKRKVEHKFEHISDFIFDNRIKVILFVLAVIIALASQMKHLTVDTSTEGFLHKTDPLRIQYDKFRDQFGRDEKVLIAIHKFKAQKIKAGVDSMKLSFILIRTINPESINKHSPDEANNSSIGV